MWCVIPWTTLSPTSSRTTLRLFQIYNIGIANIIGFSSSDVTIANEIMTVTDRRVDDTLLEQI